MDEEQYGARFNDKRDRATPLDHAVAFAAGSIVACAVLLPIPFAIVLALEEKGRKR